MGIITDRLKGQNTGIITRRVQNNDYTVNSQPIKPNIINAQPEQKSGLVSDLLKAYENLGSGIIKGGQGIAKYVSSAVRNNANIMGGYFKPLEITDKKGSKINLPSINPYEIKDNSMLNVVDKKLDELMLKKDKQIQKTTEDIKNPIVRKVGELTPSIGQMIPTIGASMINPQVGTGVAMASAGGSYIQDAKRKGATDEQAHMYGTVLGGLEGGTEMLPIGAMLKGTKEVAKSGIKVGAKQLGISAIENAIQESIMEPAQELTSQAILGKSDWNNIGQRMIQSGIDGALVSTIMAGAGAGLGKSVNVANKIAEGKPVTQVEIQQAVQESQNANKQNISTQNNAQTPIVTSQNKNTDTLNTKPINNVPAQETALNNDYKPLYTKNDIEMLLNESKTFKNAHNKIAEVDGKRNEIIYMLETQSSEAKNNGDMTQYNDLQSQIEKVNSAADTDIKQYNKIIENETNRVTKYVDSFEQNSFNTDKVLNDKKNNYKKITKYLDDTKINYEVEKNSNKITNINIKDNNGNVVEQIKSNEFENQDIIERIEKATESKDLQKTLDKQAEEIKNIPENIAKETRKNKVQGYRELAKNKVASLDKWKDKKHGIQYELNTMERNFADITPDKKTGDDLTDTYITPIDISEANKQKYINEYNERVKSLKLSDSEAIATQMLGELKYNSETKLSQETVEKYINSNKVDRKKIEASIEEMRTIYDELFEKVNQTLKEQGYKEIPYRKGYFPHFNENKSQTLLGKLAEKIGFKPTGGDLPTDIAGITYQLKPGKTWFGNAMQRKGDTTDYNALKGFDNYIRGASDIIFHTENIQKLRALENEIRYQYADKGIKDQINEIYEQDISLEEKNVLLDELFAKIQNGMPNLVSEIRSYTDSLANKKDIHDRGWEKSINRSYYDTANNLQSRVAANMVGLNISSALTNFIPISQAYANIGTVEMGKGFKDTVKSLIKDDGFTEKSTFLTNRNRQADRLYKTKLDKVNDATSILFQTVDEFSSNVIVRGKYYDNLKKGMSEQEAIFNADKFADSVMAGRSKGSLPTQFNKKNPSAKLLNMFQLEVNNQFGYMFKDLPKEMKEQGSLSLVKAFMKLIIGAYLWGEAEEKMKGNRSVFSPIHITKDIFKTLSNEDMKIGDKVIESTKTVAKELPFVGGFLGGGRLPISAALPDTEKTIQAGFGLTTGEMDSKKATSILTKELAKPLAYILPPFGGGQAKKTIEGLTTIKNKGEFGIDAEGKDTLKFPVENPTTMDYIKGGIFGKYALPRAQDYIDSGFKSLSGKQTELYKQGIAYDPLISFLNKKKEIDNNESLKGVVGAKPQAKAQYIISSFKPKEQELLFEHILTKEQNENITEDMKKTSLSKLLLQKYHTMIGNQGKKGDKVNSIMDMDINENDKSKLLEFVTDIPYNELKSVTSYNTYVNLTDNQRQDYQNMKKLNINETQLNNFYENKSKIGNKKEDVFNYINSLKGLSKIEKTILYRSCGYAVNKQTVFDYINSQKSLTKAQKQEIWKSLGY